MAKANGAMPKANGANGSSADPLGGMAEEEEQPAQRAMQNHISSSGRHAIDVLTAMGFFEPVELDD